MSTKKRSGKKQQSGISDPMKEREAQKYEHPIPSREAIMAVLEKAGEPLSYGRLSEALKIQGDRDETAFSRRLRAMERDGQLLKNRRGRYGLATHMELVPGTISAHPDGFGFLIPDAGGGDMFIGASELRKVFHGDRVMGRVLEIDRRGRQVGVIVEVLERRHQTIVGRYFDEDRMGFVAPEDKRMNQDLFIPEGDQGEAKNGQMVVAEIVRQPTAKAQAIGRVVEILGDHMAKGMEIEVAMRKFELPYIWPDAVDAQASQFTETVPDQAKQGRVDLRDVPLVTIDGEDARDFDDAVYCEPDGKGWRLLVAIADVSAYVKPGSPLEEEAYKRGTSVYFPNRVIPMLPEVLSNGLCSLNPEVDRLCMVCDMRITAAGKIRKFEFLEAVMRSHARLTYDEVAAILVDGDPALRKKREAQLPYLQNLYSLFKVLHKVRAKRGSIELEIPETYIIHDDQGRIDRIVPRERNDAHRLIEECMLAANICAAEFLAKNKMPILYRVHEPPQDEKLTNLRAFLFELGLSLRGRNNPKPKDFSAVLKESKGRPDTRLIHTVMLRSMSQAVYSPDQLGHFALAYDRYTHFTSPIRRYPDLMVHRGIKAVLAGRKARKQYILENRDKISTQGEHCSMTSRRADEAGWDVVKWLKTEYMQDKVGEEYAGIISGVANFGIFVELTDIYVEGLVHITSLGNDYYQYDAVKHRLTGERTNETLRLGDPVHVKVVRVDLDEARIDFELVDHEEVKRARKDDGKRGGSRSAGKHNKKKTGKKKTSRKKSSAKKAPRSKQRSTGRRR